MPKSRYGHQLLGNLTNITFIHIRHHPYIGQTGNRKQRIPWSGAQLHIPANLLFHNKA